MTCRAVSLSATHLSRFKQDGFLVIEQFLDEDWVVRLKERIGPLFAGQFETGIYPDEWYWREGLSLPDVTRHMANAWKSDRTVANVVLSPEIGRLAATLAGWPGARLGQDTVWWKTPGAREIALHQDSTYISYLDPPEMITCWIALDETCKDAGTIEYVRGSHTWPLVEKPGAFHAPVNNYRAAMEHAAAAVGIRSPAVLPAEVSAGSCIFHHGNIWHGSGRNQRTDKVRRSLGIHILSSQTRFRPTGAGYIYGRYQRVGDTEMDESFFPVLWTEGGYRSSFLDGYCCVNLASALQ